MQRKEYDACRDIGLQYAFDERNEEHEQQCMYRGYYHRILVH